MLKETRHMVQSFPPKEGENLFQSLKSGAQRGGRGSNVRALALFWRMNSLCSTETAKYIGLSLGPKLLPWVQLGATLGLSDVLIQHSIMSIMARSKGPPWKRKVPGEMVLAAQFLGFVCGVSRSRSSDLSQ